MILFLLILCFIALFVLLISFILFVIIFYAPNRKKIYSEKDLLPPGKIYEPFHGVMRNWVSEARNTPHETFSIKSFDNLSLYGTYYEFSSEAPIEIMFHGYRGNAERDLSGGMHRCFQIGHSALIVDQRCAGKSGGNVITFGLREHLDCLAWVEFVVSHFGPDCRIILTGISMGASTVLMAAGKTLPDNVIGVLADCGFHSAKDVICSVADSMHLPSRLLYPFVKFGAKLFGGFDLEEATPVNFISGCRVPVLFFHGEEDDYVPSHMSQINYEACTAPKKLVFIPGAGHGLSFPVAPDLYLSEMKQFFCNT